MAAFCGPNTQRVKKNADSNRTTTTSKTGLKESLSKALTLTLTVKTVVPRGVTQNIGTQARRHTTSHESMGKSSVSDVMQRHAGRQRLTAPREATTIDW